MILTGCQNNFEFQEIKVAGRPIEVQTVSSQAAMAKGLGGRDSLPPDEGMLFVYSDYRRPGFWMKDMKFPIDIIWIKDDTIIDITEKVPVAATAVLPHYWPKEPVNYVLEVNAGFVSQNNVKIGDRVEIK